MVLDEDNCDLPMVCVKPAVVGECDLIFIAQNSLKKWAIH